MSLKTLISSLPATTGVYLFKDKQGKILYVGKANHLKNRIKQYYSGHDTRPKIKPLLTLVTDIQTIEVDSEFEALLLEAALIKKHLPKYNSAAKDDKHPLYIAITKEEFPKVRTVRRNQDIGKADLYGPFPSSNTVKQVLKFLRRVFPYCSCKSNQGRPCLYASIGLCHPCPRNVKMHKYSSLHTKYNKQINLLKKLLSSPAKDAPNGASQVLKTLEREMNKAAKNKDYETAAYYRDGLQNLRHLLQPNRPINNYLDNPNLRLEIRQESLRQLQIILNTQNITPLIKQLNRIECYDISTLSGKYSTGSLVVFTQAQPDKSQYRRFKIKAEGVPNDVGMITEMLERRFRRDAKHRVSTLHQHTRSSTQFASSLPNLIVLDGGQPQLNAALKILKKNHLTIPAIALAKRLEEIYIPVAVPPPTKGNYNHILLIKKGEVKSQKTTANYSITKLQLPRANPSLQLLQHLRDEAHRFANTYRKTFAKISNLRKT
jgi:excinuclease ABC subunit C